MKVLVVNTVEFGANGITSVIMNYYRNIDKSIVKVDFVTINEISKEYKKEFEDNGSSFFCISRKKNLLVINYIFQLFKLLKKQQYDIIHIHGNSSLMAIETVTSFFANIPVRIVHAHNTTCDYMKLHKVLLPIFKCTYTHALACGKAAGLWLYGEKSFEVINNGIDLEKFIFNKLIRKKIREELNIENKVVIGHIGNFVEQKNHEFLIDIFNDLIKEKKDYILLLIGNGPLINPIKEKVLKLNLTENVIFKGKVLDVSKYLQAMDILLLPSHHEGVPVVLIEAQATGLPCLVSEYVSSEAKVTPLVEFIPIDNTKIWINRIIKYTEVGILKNRSQYQEQLDYFGYNIRKNSNKLVKLYIKYLSE